MGIFGWLRPEEEPEDSSLVEISDDKGTHVVINTPTLNDALDVEGWVRRGTRANSDRDEYLADEVRADRRWNKRDHDELRVRSGRVVDANEDLEPDHDNEEDDAEERSEQPAEGGWWNIFG